MTVDPASGTGTQIATLSGTVRYEADNLVFVNGQLLGQDHEGRGPAREFYSFDLVSGAATLIGDIGFGEGGMAFDTGTNILFGLQDAGNKPLTISTATGLGTVVGPNHTNPGFGGAVMGLSPQYLQNNVLSPSSALATAPAQ